MTYIEAAIWEKLKSLVDGRVYVSRAPDNMTDDFIVIQKTSRTEWRDLDDASGLRQSNIQVDCYGQRYYNVKGNAASVFNILDGFRGVVSYGSNSPADSVRIAAASLQNEFDSVDRVEEPYLHRVTMTFLITHE